jgi:hypothetical protein
MGLPVNIVVNIFILLSLLSFFSNRASMSGVIGCGFSEALDDAAESVKELKESIGGLLRFVKSITSAVDTITSLVGFNAVILLMAVFIFSAGLSFIGVPKGKASFLFSLLLADSIWIMWERSFSHGGMDFIFTIIKANLILLAPVVLIIIMKKAIPEAAGRVSSFLFPKGFPLFRHRVLSRDDINEAMDDYHSARMDFEKSIIKDALERGKDTGSVILSRETIESMERIKKAIDRMIVNKNINEKSDGGSSGN